MNDQSKPRRTLLERVEAIFNFIDSQEEIFPKSRLREIGLNPTTAEQWLKLIDYIQNKPKIRLIQSEHTMLIEKVEGKYQALMRKIIIDEKIPFEERFHYISDYMKSLYIRERVETSRNKSTKSKQKSVIKIINQLNQIKTSLEIFNTLDSYFAPFLNQFQIIGQIFDKEVQKSEFLKKKKVLIYSSEFKANVNRVLDLNFLDKKLPEIELDNPEFHIKLKRAKKILEEIWYE